MLCDSGGELLHRPSCHRAEEEESRDSVAYTIGMYLFFHAA